MLFLRCDCSQALRGAPSGFVEPGTQVNPGSSFNLLRQNAVWIASFGEGFPSNHNRVSDNGRGLCRDAERTTTKMAAADDQAFD
ncbi:Hypothetical protein SMAX5B_008409 [Scophthalmus maximus]|uniref:Uncharacterized protein n=1 Tax=Scophthalmus maximus TaxID=52904 RepID=A0A2U9B429_SCOMX|nr:Hypothetical protein SMAX5B_008409 [Scophthalmus maximus]